MSSGLTEWQIDPSAYWILFAKGTEATLFTIYTSKIVSVCPSIRSVITRETRFELPRSWWWLLAVFHVSGSIFGRDVPNNSFCYHCCMFTWSNVSSRDYHKSSLRRAKGFAPWALLCNLLLLLLYHLFVFVSSYIFMEKSVVVFMSLTKASFRDTNVSLG